MTDGNEGRAREIAEALYSKAIHDDDGSEETIAGCTDMILELVSAARESALREAWTRIEEHYDGSYPDDGVEVLGYRPGPAFFVCWIEDDEGCGCWFGEDGSLEAEECPTHWMPLPAPPRPPTKGTSHAEK